MTGALKKELTSDNSKKAPAFAKAITIAGVKYTHFEMREPTVDDMFNAELELSRIGGGAHTPLMFNGQMMTYQLVKVFNEQGESFDGPFTMNLLKTWGPSNYGSLRSEQAEVDKLGEASSSDLNPD